jgi:ACR3 family arsenite efflux pump ArsB
LTEGPEITKFATAYVQEHVASYFPKTQLQESLFLPHSISKMVIPILSIAFGLLAAGFVFPIYTSGLVAGLIVVPVAACTSITLGFIGLRRKPNGFCTFLNITGIVLGFLGLAALFPLLLFFLAYI